MQILHSTYKEKVTSTSSNNNGRRGSLAISALLNEVPIDPMQHPLASNNKFEQSVSPPWITNNNSNKYRFQAPMDYFHTNYSPISSGSSSPSETSSSRQSSITEPPDLWNHSRTGMHQTNSGNFIVSSLAKAKRKRILPNQYKRLMETFENTDTPSSEIRGQLAEELDMTKREVQVWFQNRRAKVSRSKISSSSSSSPSSIPNISSNSGRYHNLTSLHKASSFIEDLPRRRASEYSSSVPYGPIKSITPRRSSSLVIDQSTRNNSNNTNNYDILFNNNTSTSHVSTMVLEAPYHPTSPTIKRQNSAIDLLASAAEMMRQN